MHPDDNFILAAYIFLILALVWERQQSSRQYKTTQRRNCNKSYTPELPSTSTHRQPVIVTIPLDDSDTQPSSSTSASNSNHGSTASSKRKPVKPSSALGSAATGLKRAKSSSSFTSSSKFRKLAPGNARKPL